MRIDGKQIAETLLSGLAAGVAASDRHAPPTLAVVLVGDNPASRSYIRQKQKAADSIGGKLTLHALPADVTSDTLSGLIGRLNRDPDVHGIIIQRPLPAQSAITQEVLLSVSPEKDVDGFLPDSPYPVPVAAAVELLLRHVYGQSVNDRTRNTVASYHAWLRTRAVTVVGRGETAGKPIAAHFRKLQCATSIISSQTPDPARILSESDIIISCVGKQGIVKPEAVRRGTILISVGIWRDEEGKLHGDYEEAEIAEKAAFFTPTPGGVGPVNVACLMANLVEAYKRSN